MKRALPNGPVARAMGVGAAFFVLYALLGSQQYTAVDGGLRCLEVFRHPSLTFSGNNHLLFPVNVLSWHDLLGLIGVGAHDPFTFVRLTQLMNAAAAAASVALIYWALRAVTSQETVALAAAAGLGLSRAFLLHATNAAEPMVGLFWALVALAAACVAASRRSTPAAVGSGVALALAFASYASMALVLPALLVTMLGAPGARRRVGALLAAAALGVAAIFVFAFAFSATGAPGGMLRRFFALPGSSVWGGPSVTKLVSAPIGFVQGLLPALPPGYGGLRSLAGANFPLWRLAWLVTALLGVAALWVVLAWGALRARDKARVDRSIALFAAAAGTGFVAALLAPLAWEPLYDKLWLLPVALAFLLGGALAAGATQEARVWLSRAGLLLLAIEAAANFAWAVPAHFRESPYLAPARTVAGIVRTGDLLVTDWDPVSEAYTGLWGSASAWSLPSAAVQRGAGARDALDSAAAITEERGGAVYFLGVLDEAREQWDAFLGGRLNLPYEALDRYRDSAAVVVRFAGLPTGPTLRRY